MPRVLIRSDQTEGPSPAPNRVRWTRRQCEAIRDAGILTGRYELIDGEIITKMGQNPLHAFVVTAVMAIMVRLFGVEHVRIQCTLDVSDSSPDYNEPEPDAVVTGPPASAFSAHHPRASDLQLVVEAADTTLRFDTSNKAALYAAAGVPEYWVVDIAGRQLYVHRQPHAWGYADVAVYGADESIAEVAGRRTPVQVAELLPPV